MAERVQPFERGLDVFEGADGVGQQNDVERTADSSEDGRVLDVADLELEVGMVTPGFVDHRRAEVDPDATAWLQGREESARPAPEVEDP